MYVPVTMGSRGELRVMIGLQRIKSYVMTSHFKMSILLYLRYMILATTTVSTFVKYVFYVSDMLMEGQWEKKPVYTFYLELIRDLLHLSMYLCFFLVIFM